jgi:hypothetical protein
MFTIGKACKNHHIDNFCMSGLTNPFWNPMAEICRECGEELKTCVVRYDAGKKEFIRWKE